MKKFNEEINKTSSRRGFLKLLASMATFTGSTFLIPGASGCIASSEEETPPTVVPEGTPASAQTPSPADLAVYVNDKETDIICLKKDETYLLPLELPFKEGEYRWEIIINCSGENKKVEVKKIHHAPEELILTRDTLEGKTVCNSCSGTGQCQFCYPVGCGHTWFDDSPYCQWCNGSGKDWNCNGKGYW